LKSEKNGENQVNGKKYFAILAIFGTSSTLKIILTMVKMEKMKEMEK
jgi:hypothetical protein